MNCEIQRKIYLDGAFLVLAFAVPCFAAIGLMTLINAGTDELLAVRMADAVKEYYWADEQGEIFLQKVNQALKNTEADSIQTVKEYMQGLPEEPCCGDGDRLFSDICLNSGQSLRIELKVDWKKRKAQACSWMVLQGKEKEINQPMKVWNGE